MANNREEQMAEISTMSDDDVMTLTKGCAARLVRLLDLDAPSVILNNEYVLLGKRIAEITRRQEENSATVKVNQ